MKLDELGVYGRMTRRLDTFGRSWTHVRILHHIGTV
jgi:hypothetical protein